MSFTKNQGLIYNLLRINIRIAIPNKYLTYFFIRISFTLLKYYNIGMRSTQFRLNLEL